MKRKAGRLGRMAAGGAITAVFILPLFWVLVTSLRPVGLPPPATIIWWPQNPQWDNYAALFRLLPMSRYLGNSLLVVAVATPITWLTASLAGFAFAQLPPRLRHRWFLINIALLLIPSASVWLFRFQILRWLGLLDSLWALILPAFAAGSPLFVLLFYWSFRQIPAEMLEAARLDGAGLGALWSRIALPLVRPASAAVLALASVMYWSDFVSPVLYIYQPRYYTLPVGLQLLNQLDATNWPLLMAAAVMMTAPALLLFVWLQRLFLHDLSLSSLLDKS